MYTVNVKVDMMMEITPSTREKADELIQPLIVG